MPGYSFPHCFVFCLYLTVLYQSWSSSYHCLFWHDVSWKSSGALCNVSSVCENRNSIKKTQPPTIISKLDGRLEQYNHAIEVNYLHVCLYNVNFIVRLFAYITVNAPAVIHEFLCTYSLLPQPVLTYTCSDVYHSDLTAGVLSDTLHAQAPLLLVILTHSNMFVA